MCAEMILSFTIDSLHLLKKNRPLRKGAMLHIEDKREKCKAGRGRSKTSEQTSSFKYFYISLDVYCQYKAAKYTSEY